MKAVIPAAGVGTRLRPHTYTLPKALLYVAGKPIISHILDDVVPLGMSSIVLIVGYKGELIVDYVRRHYPDLNVEFVFQEERRGIGHAIHLCAGHANTSEPLLIVLGDTIIRTDLARITSSSRNALGVKEVEDPRRFGVCELKGDLITRLVEKPENPPSNLALVGLYYVRDAAALFGAVRHIIENDIVTGGEYQITDALQYMIDQGAEFESFMIDDWFDCGKPEALLETNRKLLEDVPQVPPVDGSIIIPPVSISPGAEIVSSIIGPYVSIAEGARVRHSIVRDSVLAERSTVEHSLLEGSLVGANAVIRGGFKQVDVGDSSEITFK